MNKSARNATICTPIESLTPPPIYANQAFKKPTGYSQAIIGCSKQEMAEPNAAKHAATEVAAEAIKDIKVLETIKDGKTIYVRP